MIDNSVTILDGGMGGELIRRGLSTSAELWSAQALLDAPEHVLEVHQDFIQAGARVIITNSYSTIPSYLGKLDMAHRFEELTQIAGQIARRAAESSEHDVLVAGSLPPLSESYRPDLVPSDAQAAPIYEALVRALNPYVDLFICETMSSAREARNAAVAARQLGEGKPIFVSWTLAENPDAGLRSGESIGDAVAAIEDLEPSALLFNCTTPEAIEVALRSLGGVTQTPIGAYPNLLHIPEGWTLDDPDIPAGRRELSIPDFVAFAERYVDAGATFIGGCCGIGPGYIAALHQKFG
ncbi:MAG: homocysteine S-methyltransferase family protein [Pseudomonadota bacterium]